MKKNYKFLIAYDGTRFFGWERQPNKPMTIQGKLESVLGEMVGAPVEVIGAGRTDAGVHAQGMVANARLDTELSETGIRDYMNHYLPDDICIREVRVASDRFHSRYNAIGKTYRYTCYVGETKPLFERKYVFRLLRDNLSGGDLPVKTAQTAGAETDGSGRRLPDIARMKKAAEFLTGQHDFASFCSNSRMKKSTVRVVDRIAIAREGDYLTFTYHGTGFLQHMVRILTGTLLEVGYGKRSPESMAELLEAKKRALAGPTAPAKGLCLIQVDYD